jgi:hypothetical protein
MFLFSLRNPNFLNLKLLKEAGEVVEEREVEEEAVEAVVVVI